MQKSISKIIPSAFVGWLFQNIELAIIGGENEFNDNKLVIKKLTSSKENDQIIINRNDLINEIKKLI